MQQKLAADAADIISEAFALERLKPAPGRRTSQNPVWVGVKDGIWKNTRSGILYERPKIDGSFTFRTLKTKNIKLAQEALARRITARSQGEEPTQETITASTVGDVIRLYIKAGFPDRQLNPRPDGTRKMEADCCQMLLGFWDKLPTDKATDKRCDEYREWRIRRLQRRTAGTRMVDLDLNTLSNAFRYAKRKELVLVNPLADRPKYHNQKAVRHCRVCMPVDADELHERAAHLFRHQRSVVLGFQYLFESFTGLRTCEILNWGVEQFGTLTPDGKYIRVWRCKNQHAVNPYCFNHEGMRALLEAHARWKAECYPESPLFFPSAKEPSKPVGIDSLAHALERLPGKKVTSHGARAFYVTVRRSWGMTDAQIAFEIGHTSGGSTLSKVYGGVPPNWLTGDGPKLGWLPIGQPAWAARPTAGGKGSRQNGAQTVTNIASRSGR